MVLSRVLLRALSYSIVVYGWGCIGMFAYLYAISPIWERQDRLVLTTLRAAVWPGILMGTAKVSYWPKGTYEI
jgi:hypothetical protein